MDQISKLWVKANFIPHIPVNIMGDYLRVTFCENPGIAFGIRVGSFQIVVTILSIIIAGVIGVYLYRERESHFSLKITLGLILGGALGNLVDRILMFTNPESYNGVIDFIDVGISNELRWYVFNVADSSVTCGIILYFIYSLFIENKLEQESKQ